MGQKVLPTSGTMVFENTNRPETRTTHIAFDDHHLVANTGLILPVTPAHHLGPGECQSGHRPVDQRF